jgi:hypothetical protein
VAGGGAVGLGDRAHAEPDSDFKGKTITIYIG